MYEDVQAVERSGIGATSYRKEMIRNVPVAAMALALVLSGSADAMNESGSGMVAGSHPGVPLWAYVFVLPFLLAISCGFVAIVYLWARCRRHRVGIEISSATTSKTHRGSKRPSGRPYRIRSQNDLVNCDELETSPSQEDVVTPASQEEGLQQRQPSDSVLQIPSVSTPKAHFDAELGTNLVASSTANEEERKPAAEAPVIHISPSPSLDEDVQRSAHRQPTPPHSPITRRFTFEDGTLMCNYPTFSDPEVISNGGSDVELHSPNNIYSSQYLGEQREKQEEVELATPTSTSDNPNGRDIVPITTGNDNSSKDGGTDVGPIELAEYLSNIGGDHLQGPEPEQQPEHPQVIPAHSNEGTSDAEGLYAVPIINPQRSAHSDSTGGIERDPSTLFDDPGYMRGMMFLRQHTSPQLPWYQDSEDWPPPTALRRAHSHGSLAVTFTEEGTSRPPAADQDLPVTLTRKSRVLASSMDALRLVNIQISELEDLDPDIAAAWFGSPAGQVVGEAVTDV